MKTILISSYKNNIKYKKLKKIVIGEWCINDFTKQKYQNDYKLKITGITKRKKSIQESLKLERSVLKKINPILNIQHEESKNNKQWQIIIGHWLRSYVRVLSNRYKHISYILKKEKIDNFKIIKSTSEMYSNDIEDFLNNVRTIHFNDEIYKKILEYKNSKTNFSIKLTNHKNFNKKNKFLIKDKVFQFFNFLFSKNDKLFISELYLSRFEEILFQIKLKIFPRFWNYDKFINYSNPNLNIRKNLQKQIKMDYSKNLENFLLQNVFLYMPTAYLEDYSKIKEFVKNNFPKKPQAIITANTFYYNELIKNYTSSKLKNTKYIVIQHGNNYGAHFDEHHESTEENTSDYFISWGFIKNKNKYLKGVMQKKLIKTRNNSENLMVMHFPFELRDKIWDNFEDYVSHIKKIQEMLIKLKDIKNIKKIIYRIPNGEHNKKKLSFLKKISKKIVFESYKTKLINNINNSNVCLFNYNSSGFYENLSNNIPSLLFVEESYLDEIDSNTRKDFINLYKNKIIHFKSDSLFNFLNENWHDLDKWWLSKQTQSAINVFIKNSAIKHKNPSSKLLKIIKKILK